MLHPSHSSHGEEVVGIGIRWEEMWMSEYECSIDLKPKLSYDAVPCLSQSQSLINAQIWYNGLPFQFRINGDIHLHVHCIHSNFHVSLLHAQVNIYFLCNTTQANFCTLHGKFKFPILHTQFYSSASIHVPANLHIH